MGSVGECFDNAMCESFFATPECELIDRHRFKTWIEARMTVHQTGLLQLRSRLSLAGRRMAYLIFCSSSASESYGLAKAASERKDDLLVMLRLALDEIAALQSPRCNRRAASSSLAALPNSNALAIR
jgi:hypothetical protein